MKFRLILFLFLLSTICYSQNYVTIGVSTTNSNNQFKQDFYQSIEIGRNFNSSSIGLSWRKDIDTDPQFHNIIKHIKNNL